FGADGLASATLVANQAAGPFNVVASLNGLSPVTFSLENTDNQPPRSFISGQKADKLIYMFGTETPQAVTIRLSGGDEHTSIAKFEYRINGGDAQLYQE